MCGVAACSVSTAANAAAIARTASIVTTAAISSSAAATVVAAAMATGVVGVGVCAPTTIDDGVAAGVLALLLQLLL